MISGCIIVEEVLQWIKVGKSKELSSLEPDYLN